MSVAPFRFQKVTLPAAQATAIQAPLNCRSVEIVNTTGADLTIQSDANDANSGFALAAGYPKALRGFAYIDPTVTAFWLTSAVGGTVVLIWS